MCKKAFYTGKFAVLKQNLLMINTISRRIYDFLKDFPPYNLIPANELHTLSENVSVQYFEAGQTVFNVGDSSKNHIFVVNQGAIQLCRNENGELKLYNKCDEGDTFGIRQVFGEDNYFFKALAEEESLIYAIPVGLVKLLLNRFPKFTLYLANSFAVNTRQFNAPEIQTAKTEVISDLINTQIYLSRLATPSSIRKAVTCMAKDTVQHAAKRMTLKRISTIVVVDEENKPLGILSDSTIRKKIGLGKFNPEELVGNIMTTPAACIKPNTSLADIQIQLIRQRVRSVCVTEDGTPKTSLIGIISEHDLIIAHGFNPAVILREIQNAESVDTLKEMMERSTDLLSTYLEREVNVEFVANIFAELYDALTVKCIELSIEEVQEDIIQTEGIDITQHKFCWLTLGSGGRREQMLRTDQDNALIFDSPHLSDISYQLSEKKDFSDKFTKQDQLTRLRNSFLQLAISVTTKLNAVGFDYCKGNMMARNPAYCLSSDEWQNQFAHWINTPNEESMLKCKIFFDFRPVFGTFELAHTLRTNVLHLASGNNLFLALLTKSSLLTSPPLGFFRNFLLEKTGDNKNALNIKNRAMVPITDAVRVLALSLSIEEVSTLQRLQKLIELDINNSEIYKEIIGAYEILMRFRTMNGLKQGNGGRYVFPEELNKLERILLRHSFIPIESLQNIIRLRFTGQI